MISVSPLESTSNDPLYSNNKLGSHGKEIFGSGELKMADLNVLQRYMYFDFSDYGWTPCGFALTAEEPRFHPC